MKIRIIYLLFWSMVLAGCAMSSAAPRFTLDVEDGADNDRTIVKRVRISATGSRRIVLTTGDRDRLSIGPTASVGSSEFSATLLLSATLTKTPHPNSNMFKWHAQIIGPTGRGGGHTGGTVPAERTLDELVALDIRPGKYPLGQSVTLGSVEGELLVLHVQ